MIIKNKQLNKNGDMWVTLEYVGNRIVDKKISKKDLDSISRFDNISYLVGEKFGTDKE